MSPDVNYRSICDQVGVFIANTQIDAERPDEFDDILKLSAVSAAVVVDCDINTKGGNREDGVDVMRGCTDVTFRRCRVGAGLKYAFTIKGGSDRIWLDDVTITRPGGDEGVDIDIGNYSSTCPDARTGMVILNNVTRSDGRPVRVRVGWAARPFVCGGNVRILFWSSLLLKVYVWFRRTFVR